MKGTVSSDEAGPGDETLDEVVELWKLWTLPLLFGIGRLPCLELSAKADSKDRFTEVTLPGSIMVSSVWLLGETLAEAEACDSDFLAEATAPCCLACSPERTGFLGFGMASRDF